MQLSEIHWAGRVNICSKICFCLIYVFTFYLKISKYFYFLVTLGSQGKCEEAHSFLKAVPKLVVRKTQLEIFLSRKVSVRFMSLYSCIILAFFLQSDNGKK